MDRGQRSVQNRKRFHSPLSLHPSQSSGFPFFFGGAAAAVLGEKGPEIIAAAGGILAIG